MVNTMTPSSTNQNKMFIDPKTLLVDSFRLAKMVYDDRYIPDMIIAVWRGGTPVGIAVHEFFRYKGYNPAHTAVKCGLYSGFAPGHSVEISGVDTAVTELTHDDRLLIVDDVFDSGVTLSSLINDIKTKKREETPEIRIATVYYKPRNNKTGLEPDYFIKRTNRWLVFPHELEGLSENELRKKGKIICDLFRAD